MTSDKTSNAAPGSDISSDSCRSLSESLREYGRGIAGGLLFSLPLLYTMEVWWQGFTAHPFRLFLYVLATYILLLGYNRYAGLREDATWSEVAVDSVEEMGIGLLLSAFILWLLGRISHEIPASEALGKIIIEAMTVAIGVSVGTAQLGSNEQDESQQNQNGDENKNQEQKDEAQKGESPDYLAQVAIATCGAVLIAANVGPTEEIVMLAIESPPWKLLALAVFSFALSTLILHYADIRGSERYVLRESTLQMARGAITTYAVALLASALICWFFGRFDGASLDIIVAQTVVLAFPAALGASAGRLLLQMNSQN